MHLAEDTAAAVSLVVIRRLRSRAYARFAFSLTAPVVEDVVRAISSLHVIDDKVVILCVDHPFVPEGRVASLMVRDAALTSRLAAATEFLRGCYPLPSRSR